MNTTLAQAITLLNAFAEKAAKADSMLELISSETPIDHAHYAQVESERNTLHSVCRTVEAICQLEAGSAEVAIKHALARVE